MAMIQLVDINVLKIYNKIENMYLDLIDENK